MVSLAMKPLAVTRIPETYGITQSSRSGPLPLMHIRIRDEAAHFEESLRRFGISTGATDPMAFVDKVEELMTGSPNVKEQHVEHVFTPGMYSRTIFMDRGDITVSKIHRTRHQFVIAQGAVSVWTKEEGVVTHHAPYHGVTNPDTRRILFVHTDTIWTTFHPTDKTTVEEVEADIIMKHVNPLLQEGGIK